MRAMVLAFVLVGCGAPATSVDGGSAFDPGIQEAPQSADGGGPVCQIGTTPGSGAACGSVPWVWTDNAATIHDCAASQCLTGMVCHFLSGYPGYVNQSGMCVSAQQGAMACDSTIPWEWLDPSGRHSCQGAPQGAECMQLIAGICR